MADKIRVLVWSEHTAPRDMYPNDINGAVADGLRKDDRLEVSIAEYVDPDQGVSEETLAQTDVLAWWGHMLHRQVTDETVDRIERHVKERGMGFLALHSSHMAKPFTRLIGDDGRIGGVKHDAGPEQIKVLAPDHPIAKGITDFAIDDEEMYDEEFGCGTPDTVVFHSTFPGGHEFRSGCAYQIGNGRVFYFRPGHEENPTYYRDDVQLILNNAVHWAAPSKGE
ncbi:ThuA domain-containing protein [Tenggerimyces flavus]|uniref:ThuA domain-containing protein n=1 Tax=Tenggerimyces flavus TaxID=1708749 RepID=A0ABV7YJC4_9ACTN|nr:ThuA domain-containing protein [Tenggerimyces flavus]MBM7783962.1 trehalose utilization protein [Tenggerimyces flavus]